jgi:hypothetical protein
VHKVSTLIDIDLYVADLHRQNILAPGFRGDATGLYVGLSGFSSTSAWTNDHPPGGPLPAAFTVRNLSDLVRQSFSTSFPRARRPGHDRHSNTFPAEHRHGMRQIGKIPR